jgi:hypothetical protein
MRARAVIRAWEYRQRRHARGVWFRLRRVLADASQAFIVPSDETRRLVSEGHRVESVGYELEPPKLIVFAPADRVAQIGSALSVPVRLGAELLAAECLVLTPFEQTS